MKFCLSAEEALPYASKILKSIFSHPDFSELFIENIEKNLE